MATSSVPQPIGSLTTTPSSAFSVQSIPRQLRKFRKRYAVRVIVQGLFTIWAVTTITFFLIRLMPGNPIDIKIEQLQRAQGINYIEAKARASNMFGFNPDQPVMEQYVVYMGKLLQFQGRRLFQRIRHI